MTIKDSALVRMATEARRPTPWWLGWIIAFGIGVIAAQALWALPQQLAGATHGTVPGQVFELLVNATTIAVVALWVRVKERRAFSSVGFRGPAGLRRFLVGIVAGVVIFAVPTGFLLLTGLYQVVPTPAGATGGLAALPVVLALVLVWVVQGSGEEIVMRGYLLQIHALQMPGWAAVLVTSLGFAVAHVGASPLALVNITLVALFFALLSLRQGSIWLACGIHAGWNYTQGNLLGIPVSGNGYTESLVFLRPVPGSPDWLTGGDFGIEESFAATVVLAALALGALLSLRRAAPPATA